MAKINMVRVVLGGLLAGLVLNIGEFLLNEPILGKQWAAAMESLNRSATSGSQVAWFVVMSFVLGIAMVWLYAGIRPRYGAGPKTAICAGLTVWFLVWVWGFGGTLVMGLYPTGLVLITVLWGLVEVPLAALAGAWLYKEEERMQAA